MHNYISLYRAVKVVSCIFSNTCMGLAVNVISILELQGDGFQLSDFTEPVNADDAFNMYAVISMLTFDFLLYMIIAW